LFVVNTEEGVVFVSQLHFDSPLKQLSRVNVVVGIIVCPMLCVCVYVCVSVTLSVNSPTGQTPQQIFTVDSLKDSDLRKDVFFGGLDDE